MRHHFNKCCFREYLLRCIFINLAQRSASVYVSNVCMYACTENGYNIGGIGM